MGSRDSRTNHVGESRRGFQTQFGYGARVEFPFVEERVGLFLGGGLWWFARVCRLTVRPLFLVGGEQGAGQGEFGYSAEGAVDQGGFQDHRGVFDYFAGDEEFSGEFRDFLR